MIRIDRPDCLKQWQTIRTFALTLTPKMMNLSSLSEWSGSLITRAKNVIKYRGSFFERDSVLLNIGSVFIEVPFELIIVYRQLRPPFYLCMAIIHI